MANGESFDFKGWESLAKIQRTMLEATEIAYAQKIWAIYKREIVNEYMKKKIGTPMLTAEEKEKVVDEGLAYAIGKRDGSSIWPRLFELVAREDADLIRKKPKLE
ncbi:hypothetical protein DL767_011219 [Monosporascus sp. MG133]|nr:hypothetical protein DL767_011219 [Monosporascus sp. MG133]